MRVNAKELDILKGLKKKDHLENLERERRNFVVDACESPLHMHALVPHLRGCNQIQHLVRHTLRSGRLVAAFRAC